MCHWMGVGIIVGLVGIGGSGAWNHDQPPACTFTVQAGQAIQPIIDQAPVGAVICLEEGIFQAQQPLEITKDRITLRGAGPHKTLLQQVVILIQGLHFLEAVVLEDLAFTGEINQAFVQIVSAEVTIRNVRIGPAIGGFGIAAAGATAAVKVQQSRLFGLFLGLASSGGLEIERSFIFGNDYGVMIAAPPKSKPSVIRETRLAANGVGLVVAEASEVEVQSSTIELNRVSVTVPIPLKNNVLIPAAGDGILVEGQSRLTIVSSQVVNNLRYGVAAYLEQCGLGQDSFTGEVKLINTVVEDNEQGNICLP
jgi:hypothetical protein